MCVWAFCFVYLFIFVEAVEDADVCFASLHPRSELLQSVLQPQPLPLVFVQHRIHFHVHLVHLTSSRGRAYIVKSVDENARSDARGVFRGRKRWQPAQLF